MLNTEMTQKENGNMTVKIETPKGFMSFKNGDVKCFEVIEADTPFKYIEGYHHECFEIYDGQNCSIIKENEFLKWTPPLSALNELCTNVIMSGLKYVVVKRTTQGEMGNRAKIAFEVLDEEGFKKKTKELFIQSGKGLKIGMKGAI